MRIKVDILRFLVCIIIFKLTVFTSLAQVDKYIYEYKVKQVANSELEQQLIESVDSQTFLDQLSACLSDTIVVVRYKSYELLYRKGIAVSSDDQTLIVEQLTKGCLDKNSTILYRCLQYLQDFPQKAFNHNARLTLERLLRKTSGTYYKELILMAGYLSLGQEILKQKLLLSEDFTPQQIWHMHLALARMGDVKSTAYCIQLAKKVPDGNDKVAYVLPDLIYTRQKDAIAYCIEVLNDDRENCLSPDPDSNEQICCGYRVMELLAPLIEGFPFQVDASGTLNTENYQEALHRSRKWFASNPDFHILTHSF